MFHGVRWFSYYGITHAQLILSTINSSLPMDIALEKGVPSFLWASLNSENKVVKMVTLSSIKADRSVLWD